MGLHGNTLKITENRWQYVYQMKIIVFLSEVEHFIRVHPPTPIVTFSSSFVCDIFRFFCTNFLSIYIQSGFVTGNLDLLLGMWLFIIGTLFSRDLIGNLSNRFDWFFACLWQFLFCFLMLGNGIKYKKVKVQIFFWVVYDL